MEALLAVVLPTVDADMVHTLPYNNDTNTAEIKISQIKITISQESVVFSEILFGFWYKVTKTLETFLIAKRFHCEKCFYLCAMEEKEVFILEETSKLFIRYGIRSVSMDDVARHLGMSKKTLYQYFSDKHDLVLTVMNHHLQDIDSCFKQISEKEGNAIDILMMVSRLLIDKFGRLNSSISFDLQKYYPEAFKAMMEHKHNHILENIERNLKRGIQEGLYRKDINTRVIAYFYMIRMDHVFDIDPDNELMKNISLEEILRELFVYHIRGIANNKGIEYFETKLLKDLKSKK